jgi:hypothetical protein
MRKVIPVCLHTEAKPDILDLPRSSSMGNMQNPIVMKIFIGIDIQSTVFL